MILDIGADIDFGNEAGLSMEILLGDEFLDCVDSYRLVDSSAGAGILAAAVADTAADSRERIFSLDEFESLAVFSFRSLLEIALDGNMSGACGLARSRTGRVAVDSVAVAIVLVPLLRSPFHCIGEFLLGISLRSVLRAELLSELDRSCRAILNTASAGNAVIRVHFGHIGAAGHIRSIEELGGTKRIADLYIAVADCENLPVSVNIGNLVDESMILGLFEDCHTLVVGDIVAAICFNEVFGHIADTDAPVVIIVGAAFIQLFPSDTAGADTYCEVAFISLEPI